jgi:hypothetical protein
MYKIHSESNPWIELPHEELMCKYCKVKREYCKPTRLWKRKHRNPDDQKSSNTLFLLLWMHRDQICCYFPLHSNISTHVHVCTFTHKHAHGLQPSEHWEGNFDSAGGIYECRTAFRCATFTHLGRGLVMGPSSLTSTMCQKLIPNRHGL